MKMIVLFLLLVSEFSYGAETIPFKIKTRRYIPVDVSNVIKNSSSAPVMVEEKESIVNVATDKITKAIEDVRSGVCKTIKNGHLKMWFSVSASGTVLVAEESQEAGIEVQFDCATEASKKETK